MASTAPPSKAAAVDLINTCDVTGEVFCSYCACTTAGCESKKIAAAALSHLMLMVTNKFTFPPYIARPYAHSLFYDIDWHWY